MGIEHTIREKGSPVGVMTAARISTMQKACLRYFLNVCLVTIPIADNKAITVGNSKTTPKARTVETISAIYEDKENVLGTSALT